MSIETSAYVEGNTIHVTDYLLGTNIQVFSRYDLTVEEGGVLTTQGTAELIRTSCGLRKIDEDNYRGPDYSSSTVINFPKESTQPLRDFLTDLPTTDLDALGLLFYIIANTNRLPNVVEVAFATSKLFSTLDRYDLTSLVVSLSKLTYLNSAINYCTSTFNTNARLCDLGGVDLNKYSSGLSWYCNYLVNISSISEIDIEDIKYVSLYTLDVLAKLVYTRDYFNCINISKLVVNPIEGGLLVALYRQDYLNTSEQQELLNRLVNAGYFLYS